MDLRTAVNEIQALEKEIYALEHGPYAPDNQAKGQQRRAEINKIWAALEQRYSPNVEMIDGKRVNVWTDGAVHHLMDEDCVDFTVHVSSANPALHNAQAKKLFTDFLAVLAAYL